MATSPDDYDQNENKNIAESSSTLPVAPASHSQTPEQPTSSPPTSSQEQLPPRRFSDKPSEDRDRIRLALHRSPYFTCLDEEQVERFIELARLEEYSPEQAVILEGCRDERDSHCENLQSPMQEPNADNVQIPRRLSTDGYADSDEFILLDGEGDEFSEIPLRSESEIRSNGSTPTEENFSPPQSPDALLVQDQNNFRSSGANPGSPPSPASLVIPPAPTSGKRSSVYIIQTGTADVFYDTMTPASIGPGTMFGEGGFLFGLPHSASIVAQTPLECWVIDYETFCKAILPSDNMKRLFNKYATHHQEDDFENVAESLSTAEGDQYMTMDDFIESCLENSSKIGNRNPSENNSVGKVHMSSIESTFQNLMILSKQQSPFFSHSVKSNKNTNRVHFTEFCLFHMLMARPDPEVDIAFLLMDRQRTGRITFDDFAAYIENGPFPYFDLKSEFVRRHFGSSGQRTIRNFQFSQFL